MRSGKLALWRTSWIGDYPDPENFLALFYSQNNSPKAEYDTSEFPALDSLYEQALPASPQPRPTVRPVQRNGAQRYRLCAVDFSVLQYSTKNSRPSVIGLRPEGIDRLILEAVDKNKWSCSNRFDIGLLAPPGRCQNGRLFKRNSTETKRPEGISN